MEGAWPALIDALVEERPQRRARLLWTTLAWINVPWIGWAAINTLYLEGEGQAFGLGVFLICVAYTLFPSILFVLAYGLWLWMGRRKRPAPPRPMVLDAG